MGSPRSGTVKPPYITPARDSQSNGGARSKWTKTSTRAGPFRIPPVGGWLGTLISEQVKERLSQPSEGGFGFLSACRKTGEIGTTIKTSKRVHLIRECFMSAWVEPARKPKLFEKRLRRLRAAIKAGEGSIHRKAASFVHRDDTGCEAL
jgi:hypothetical protein